MESPRLDLARRIAAERRRREERNLLAVGVTGSVARGLDRRYSDLDMFFLVRRPSDRPRYALREGVLITFLEETEPEARDEVGGAHPGLPEALAGWRAMRPLYDPHGYLGRLIGRAQRPPTSLFRRAARIELLGTYEDLGKIRNAAEAGERGVAREMAIWYTGGATLALFDLRGHVPPTDTEIFEQVRRMGRLGRDLYRLRYGNLSLTATRRLAEDTWAGLLRAARRQGIDVRGLD